MAKKRVQKRKHTGNFLFPKNGQTLQEFEKMDPGMIINFVYKKGTTDKEPLVFILYVDKSNGMIEGLNLNYLVHQDITFFFNSLENLGVEAQLEDFRRLQHNYLRFALNTKFTPNRFDAKVVYNKLFPMNRKLGKAYRKYSFQSMSRTKLINYNIESALGSILINENKWLGGKL